MRYTDPNQLVVGTEVYEVLAFRDRSVAHIQRERVTAVKVKTRVPNAWFNDFERLELWPGCTSLVFDPSTVSFKEHNILLTGRINEHSLKDMGIIANTYNDHQSFSALRDAVDYILDFFGARATFNAPAWYLSSQSTASGTVADYDRAMGVVGR